MSFALCVISIMYDLEDDQFVIHFELFATPKL